jgi:hypothetical protein
LKKGADPNITDLEGQASLHYIAKYTPKGNDHENKYSKAIYQKEAAIQKKIA